MNFRVEDRTTATQMRQNFLAATWHKSGRELSYRIVPLEMGILSFAEENSWLAEVILYDTEHKLV